MVVECWLAMPRLDDFFIFFGHSLSNIIPSQFLKLRSYVKEFIICVIGYNFINFSFIFCFMQGNIITITINILVYTYFDNLCVYSCWLRLDEDAIKVLGGKFQVATPGRIAWKYFIERLTQGPLYNKLMLELTCFNHTKPFS